MGPVTLIVLVDIDDLPDARLDQEKKAGITRLQTAIASAAIESNATLGRHRNGILLSMDLIGKGPPVMSLPVKEVTIMQLTAIRSTLESAIIASGNDAALPDDQGCHLSRDTF